MFELITLLLFLWLMAKVIGLAFRLTWGVAKILAAVLMVVAAPLFVVCLIFAGGIVLLAPLALIGIAFAIVKACV